MRRSLPPQVVLVKKKGTTSGLRSANLQSGGYGGWRPRFSSFAGRRRQVRGRWGAGCLKSLAPEEHFSRFPAARLRGRAVPCAARCGAAAMRSSFRLFVRPNGLFLFFRITHGLSARKAAALRVNLNINGCSIVAPPARSSRSSRACLTDSVLSHSLPMPHVH